MDQICWQEIDWATNVGFVFPLRSEEKTKLQKGCSQFGLHLMERVGEREMGSNGLFVLKLHSTWF